MGGCALSVELGLLGLLTPFAAFLLFSVLRSTYGLLGSAAATATQALIAVETAGAARTRAITTLAGALSLGTIVGPAIAPMMIVDRSEERRVGTECFSTCRSRGSPSN